MASIPLSPLFVVAGKPSPCLRVSACCLACAKSYTRRLSLSVLYPKLLRRPAPRNIPVLSLVMAAVAIASTGLSSLPATREIPIKCKALGGKTSIALTAAGRKLNAAKGGVSSVCEPLPPDRPLWFPGSAPPQWLDGSLPGDFGFDPLGLGSDPELLKWFAQAELMHSRWAMLGVAGILIPEWLESLGLIDNFSWYDAGSREYFADPTTLFVVQIALMGWVEGRRWADMIKPGCVDIEPTYPNKEKPKADVGYPGGIWFDPLMWGRGSPEPVMILRTKEIKNGRLAMLAFLGFCFQAIYTGQGPIDNLMAHIADPGHCNVFSAFTSQ